MGAVVPVRGDRCNSGELTFGECGSWSDTDSWDCSECTTAAREVVVAAGTSGSRIEESWNHQSLNEGYRQRRTESELGPEVEVVADYWNGCRVRVESSLLPPPLVLASMAVDLCCKVSVDPCSHC